MTVLQVDSKMMKVDNKVEPITTIDTESKENGIPLLHYFSWFSDIFLSIASAGIWAMIPTHNMLEEPSYL